MALVWRCRDLVWRCRGITWRSRWSASSETVRCRWQCVRRSSTPSMPLASHPSGRWRKVVRYCQAQQPRYPHSDVQSLIRSTHAYQCPIPLWRRLMRNCCLGFFMQARAQMHNFWQMSSCAVGELAAPAGYCLLSGACRVLNVVPEDLGTCEPLGRRVGGAGVAGRGAG